MLLVCMVSASICSLVLEDVAQIMLLDATPVLYMKLVGVLAILHFRLSYNCLCSLG